MSKHKLLFREEIILGSIDDFRALMHEIYEFQPQMREDSIYLQGERTPSDYPQNMGRWEVTLGGTFQKRGFVIARQLPNGTTKLQFAYHSKFKPIGSQFDVEFVNQIISQSTSQVELVPEVSKSISENRVELLQNLGYHFNIEELRMIAFEMRIQHENFQSRRDSFAREFFEHCERHQCIEKLLEICQRERPKIIWQ